MSGAEGLLFELLKKALQQAVASALQPPPRGAGTVDKPVRPGRTLRRRRTPKTRLDHEDVRKMAGTLAKRLEPLRRYELGKVPDHEWEAALAAVCDSLAASGPLDVDLMFRLDLNPARLFDHVIAASGSIHASAQLSLAAKHVYKLLLDLTCRHLVEYVTTLPQFQHIAHVHEMRRLREIEDVFAPHDESSAAEAALFERRYLDEVGSKLDQVELFGISLSRRARRYTMSTAYISLALRARAEGAPPATGTAVESSRGHGLRVESALAGQRRVLVRGLAGSGKTTLLQWFALRAARNDFASEMAGWQGLMPFFLPLRQYIASRELPTPERFPEAVAPMLASEAPENWVRQRLLSGRALVLVDGVDEVPEAMREEAEEWLRALVRLFPSARYVVSSRPSAIDDRWLADAGFASYEVLPMSRADVREFIMRWHAAARENCDDDEVALLDRCERALNDGVAAQPHLSRLATNPLLCALLCALHRDRRAHLPRDRHELYDAALDMLLYRRDQERELEAPEGVELSTTTATALLQRIAYWMLRNGLSAVSREVLVQQVDRALRAMPHVEAPAEVVVRHLVARTGLLREPVPGSVDFLHRTFQDYLAAKAAVDENDLGLLVNMAHDDRWHDVVIMAVPHSRTAERSRLLDSLLNRGDDEPGDRKRLHLLAAAGLELATEVDPSVIQGVRQRTAQLVPPRSVDEADELALAGDFVLGLLPAPSQVDDVTAAACVRTAATVGGAVALSFLTRCAGETRPEVLRELASAWRRFDAEDYAEAVLRQVVPLPGVWLSVEGQAMLEALRHLPAVDRLYCSKVDDYAPLADLPAAGAVWIVDIDQGQLGVVARLSGLRGLILDDCPRVTDLIPLEHCQIERMEFRGAAMSPLTGLSRMDSLRQVALDGLHRAAETLEQLLPADLRLEWLRLGNVDYQPRLAGIEQWSTLRGLELAGWPEQRDFDRLAGLPRLTALSLAAEGVGPDLAPLSTLEHLQTLTVTAEFDSYCDLRPLVALPQLRRLELVGTLATQFVTVDLHPLSAGRDDLTVRLVDYQADPDLGGLDPGRVIVESTTHL